MENLKLKNKVSLITGAGRGIGREIAIEFAKNGSVVFINDINEKDAVETCKIISSLQSKEFDINNTDKTNSTSISNNTNNANDANIANNTNIANNANHSIDVNNANYSNNANDNNYSNNNNANSTNNNNNNNNDYNCNYNIKNNSSCFYYIADVSNLTKVKDMFEFIIKKTGKLDILVNNAAILRDKTIHNMDINYHWEEVLKVNLSGVFYCCREAMMIMRQNNYGKIINIASVIGLCGNFGQTAYGASKAGVIGLTKSLAYEAAARNINVNAIAPGFIETEMIKDIPDNIKENIINRIPLKRLGKPKDIAKMALFLASSDADYITGQVFSVNGGYFMY